MCKIYHAKLIYTQLMVVAHVAKFHDLLAGVKRALGCY